MYLHCASKLLLKIHHTINMPQISVEGMNNYTLVNGLNCRKLKDSVVGHWSAHWKSFSSEISILLMWDAKEPKAIAELISIPQKHQQSMWSSPQRIQYGGLDPVDPISKTDAQNTGINLITNPWAHHLQYKSTKELIICINAMTIETTIVQSLQELYHFKLHNKFSLVITYHLVSAPLKTSLGKRKNIQFLKEVKQSIHRFEVTRGHHKEHYEDHHHKWKLDSYPLG